MGLGIKTKLKSFWKVNICADRSINGLSSKLDKWLKKDGGFYIEVGGNDGLTQSNSFYFEKKRGWTGVLVEAIPSLYEKCCKNRPNSKVYGCALVSKEFDGDVVLMHDSNLMSTVDGALGNDQKDHLKLSQQYVEEGRIKKVEVPARTLESLLDEAGIKQYDFMSLDVEGYEAEVLKGMNLEKWGPNFLLIEVRDMDAIMLVISSYYDLVEQLSHHDYLFRKK